MPGATPEASAEGFNDFMMMQLYAATPLSQTMNGVRIGMVAGRTLYARNCVQKLQRDELTRALEVIEELFCQTTPPRGSVAEWSLLVEASGIRVGEVFVLEGDHQGEGDLGCALSASRKASSRPCESTTSCTMTEH